MSTDYEKQLEKIQTFAGFVAALDQSGGSTPKALKLYGIPDNSYVVGETSMYDKMHSYRERIMKSPMFNGNRIIGTILFENTLRRTITVDTESETGVMESKTKPIAHYLWQDLEIVPFLKIDQGLMSEHDGVQLMKEIKNLHMLLDLAVDQGVFGTKARSLIKHANERGIKAIVEQQFTIARTVMQHGNLHPIIEPEVDIHIEKEEKKQAESILVSSILDNLNKLKSSPPTERVILKLTLPTVTNLYKESGITDHPNVLRVVALSGGYSRQEANELLVKNEDVVASFSRALTEGLEYGDTEDEFDTKLDDSIESIYLASVSGMYE